MQLHNTRIRRLQVYSCSRACVVNNSHDHYGNSRHCLRYIFQHNKMKENCLCGKRIELKSSCCGADVSVGGDREQFENTCFYVCGKCKKPCDARAQEMKRAGEKASCDYGMNPSEKAYKCARYEQCDECYGKDNPPQQGEKCGCECMDCCKSLHGEGHKPKSPSTWEERFDEKYLVLGENHAGWNRVMLDMKSYIRTILAEAERTAVRKCLEDMTPESEAEKELMAEFDSRFKGWEGGTIASVLNAEIAQMRDFLLTAYRKGYEMKRAGEGRIMAINMDFLDKNCDCVTCKPKKCGCKEMSCLENCDGEHTHKEFYCEACRPKPTEPTTGKKVEIKECEKCGVLEVNGITYEYGGKPTPKVKGFIDILLEESAVEKIVKRIPVTIDFPEYTIRLTSRNESIRLGCAHGRPSGAMCPHCLGINDYSKMPEVTITSTMESL